MPQNKSYDQIIFDNKCDMSKEIVSLKNQVGTSPPANIFPSFSQIIGEQFLAEKILFACTRCGSALVQASTCIVCHKTTKRFCVTCNHVREFGNHDSCQSLVHMTWHIQINSEKEGNT